MIQVKRGDTFRLQCVLRDGTPLTPVSLTGASIRAQVRTTKAALVAVLTVTIANQSTSRGAYSLTATPEETEAWPLGNLECDVEYTFASGDVASTPTFSIRVLPDVTRD
jgi:hypothetical protein